MIYVYTRRMNDAPWALYGEMTWQEYENEKANIAWLGLYVHIQSTPRRPN